MYQKRNNKYLKYLLIILLIILIIIGIFSYNKYEEEKHLNQNLTKDKKINTEESLPPKETYINQIPTYRNQYNNQYIMGKLEIPGVKIDTLVTRYFDNSFYLNNNIYNQNDGLGVPFFDYRNTDLASSKQINIYGHNTQNPDYYSNLPFVNLELYTDKNIFDNYKNIYLNIDEKRIEYEIIAIKIVINGNTEHMRVAFTDEEDFLNHMNRLLSDTLYVNSDLKITKDSKILVLQVCHYNPLNSYLLVICQEK